MHDLPVREDEHCLIRGIVRLTDQARRVQARGICHLLADELGGRRRERGRENERGYRLRRGVIAFPFPASPAGGGGEGLDVSV